MGMASVLLSDSSVCPHVHKAMLKLEEEQFHVLDLFVFLYHMLSKR